MRIVVWGNGNYWRKYAYYVAHKLDVAMIVDKNALEMQPTVTIGDKEVPVRNIEDIQNDDLVLIAVRNTDECCKIEEYLDNLHVKNMRISDYIQQSFISDENTITEAKCYQSANEIVKFLDVLVPTDACNLRCPYCFVMQNSSFMNEENIYHSPKYIRAAFSQKRWGGKCFVNLCGNGETLLFEQLVDVVAELIEEGHYVQIVTNATISKRIDELLGKNIDFSNLFMKCSLQYMELKRLKLLNTYAENVKRMHEAGISISVEVTPHDELIPYIDEIKQFSMKNFGAFPHISTAWDSSNDFVLLSKMSIDEYRNTWGVFDSEMFNFKIKNFGKKVNGFCYAGQNSYNINLSTGDVMQCVCRSIIDNIYIDITRPIRALPVGTKCELLHCYNNHGYLAWGDIPSFDAPTYYDMRNRKTMNGKNWIYPEMARVMKQKIRNDGGTD